MNATEELSEADLLAATNDPWWVTAEEWRIKDHRQEVLADLRALMAQACPRAVCHDEHGKVVAMAGCIDDGERIHTFFFASSLMEAHGARLSRVLRAWLRGIRASHPDREIVSRSRPVHPAQQRWFRVLGFEEAQGSEGATTFRYRMGGSRGPSAALGIDTAAPPAWLR